MDNTHHPRPMQYHQACTSPSYCIREGIEKSTWAMSSIPVPIGHHKVNVCHAVKVDATRVLLTIGKGNDIQHFWFLACCVESSIMPMSHPEWVCLGLAILQNWLQSWHAGVYQDQIFNRKCKVCCHHKKLAYCSCDPLTILCRIVLCKSCFGSSFPCLKRRLELASKLHSFLLHVSFIQKMPFPVIWPKQLHFSHLYVIK